MHPGYPLSDFSHVTSFSIGANKGVEITSSQHIIKNISYIGLIFH